MKKRNYKKSELCSIEKFESVEKVVTVVTLWVKSLIINKLSVTTRV